MRIYTLVVLLLSACGTINRESDEHDIALEEANIDSVDDASESGSCICQYYPPENIELVFSTKSLNGDLYNVDFIVQGSSEEEFVHHARLWKSCIDEIEKRRVIPATLRRKRSGTCSPLVILPNDYDPKCWSN